MRRPCARIGLPTLAAIIAILAFPAIAGAAPTPRSWVGLDSGRVGDYLWSVKTKPGVASSPCLLVGTTWELGPFNYRRSRYRACAGVGDQMTATEPPVIATSVQPATGSTIDMTAVGMIFPRAAAKVRITLQNGRRATIPLHRIRPSRAQASRLSRFQYAAFAVHGLWCAAQIVSVDSSGRVLWDSGMDAYSCNPDGTLKPPTFEGTAPPPEYPES